MMLLALISERRPVDAVHSAIDRECLVAQCPGDLILGVVVARVLPGDPAVRNTMRVERQDEGIQPTRTLILKL